MATNFREFVLENQNSINVKVKLEAPVGRPVIETEVRANASVKLDPSVSDIRTARITVIAGGDEHTDIETLDMSGLPSHLFFETLRARTIIGSINGVVSAAF
jgi:hypothetical protein